MFLDLLSPYLCRVSKLLPYIGVLTMANYIPKSAFVKAPKKVINNIETNIMMNIAGIAANASFTSIQTMLVNFISTS